MLHSIKVTRTITRTFINSTFNSSVSNGFALLSCCSFNCKVHVRYLVSVESVDYDIDVDGFLVTCLAKEDIRLLI